MTPIEFKAWFDGFTEAMDRLPTKVQWARIKERVAEIDGKPVTEHHYYRHYWPSYFYWNGSTTSTTPTYGTYTVNNADACAGNSFTGTTAMYALGKADSANLAGG